MTYVFSIKLKKGSSITDECPGRTPFGFIVPRAHKHRYRLQWPLSRKRQRPFPFPLRSHNNRKRGRYRKFLPLLSTGQASRTLPNLFSFCTRSHSRVRRRQGCTAAWRPPVHRTAASGCGSFLSACFFYPTAEPPKTQRIFFFEIPNEHCRHIQDTFYPPCNFPYNSTAVLKRLQHSHITKEAFRYGTTAK